MTSIPDVDKYILNEHCRPLLKKGCTYFDILLYNCYDPCDYSINIEKLSCAFDDLISIYEKLFDFSLTLSGYQFIGLFLQSNLSDSISLELQIAYFILSCGFIVSMFGSLMCFITIEYLRGCRDENPEFIIVGIQKYKHIFKSADKIIYINCVCFAVPINILIHSSLNFAFAISYNALCCILFFIGIYYHFIIIMCKQEYIIYGKSNITNINSTSSINSTNQKIKYRFTRKIYS